MILRVPERGRIEVDAAAWRRLEKAPAFWALVEKRIITVEHLGAGRVCLVGGCFVGRAQVDEDSVLEVHEKVDGALAALLTHATRSSFRVEHMPAPASDLGPLIGLLAKQYVDALRRNISRGREFVYERQKRVGSLVGGKLDVTGTIRLRARGLAHLVQFDRIALVHKTPFNRVALAALREVDRLARLVQVDPETIAEARALAMLFSDCRDAGVLFGSRSELVRVAQGLSDSARDESRRDVLALAMLLLSHESFEHSSTSGSRSPRAWFLNLETLFEAAVRNTLAAVAPANARVEAGRDAPMPVFPTMPTKEYRANPDLVIRLGGPVAAIGDVKYKNLEDRPDAGDLYQLIVHSTAFQSTEAFLVYPGDAFTSVDIGPSRAGPRVRVFAVDPRHLEDHLRRLLGEMHLPAAGQAGSTAA